MRHRADHAAIAGAYQRSVLAGKSPCGRFFRLAVERQVEDLKRYTGGEVYTFSEDEGARVCRFIELFCHTTGTLAGRPIVLSPWQVWLLVVGFGWRRVSDGRMRFREFSWWLCRGQGKSTIAALVALYMFRQAGSQVVCGATSTKQARVVWDTARVALLARPEIAERFEVTIGKHSLDIDRKGSWFRPVSSEARGHEGQTPLLVILDEAHAHQSRELHDTLKSGCAKRTDSLFFVVSTAPTKGEGIGLELWNQARDVLEGHLQAPTIFAVVIAADRDLDPYSLPAWEQANPGLGESVDREYIASEAMKAQRTPSLRPTFFSRHLGWLTDQDHQWISLAEWDACEDRDFRLEDMANLPSYIGLDLALTRDLTATTQVWVRADEQGLKHFYVRSHAWLAEESETLRETPQLRDWADEGWLTLTPGAVTDFALVQAAVQSLCEANGGSEVCYDPWSASPVAQGLTEAGCTCVEVRQGPITMSAPMKLIEAAVLSRTLHHDGNPVLRMCISNCRAKSDINDNIRPARSNPSQKIDCAVALIDAMVRAQFGQPQAVWFAPYRPGDQQ